MPFLVRQELTELKDWIASEARRVAEKGDQALGTSKGRKLKWIYSIIRASPKGGGRRALGAETLSCSLLNTASESTACDVRASTGA